jgi:hypothetical protein
MDFLCENPIRKGKIHTLYGFYLCTQFSSMLLKFLAIGKARFNAKKKSGQLKNRNYYCIITKIESFK